MAYRELVVASDGIDLGVRDHGGPAGGPHVVLVHGYPDDQTLWRGVVERLGTVDFHLVSYDVRGTGTSGVPPTVAGYRTEHLVEDLIAVVGATVPRGDRFHLVGHDWGSVQLWDVVAAEECDPRLRGRVASFTSVSGPSLDHLGLLARRRDGRRLRLLHQLGRSWYVYLFHVPTVPELLWRWGDRPARALSRWLDPEHRRVHGHPGLGENAANGLNLYRANVLRRTRDPRAWQTDVPVLVVAPRRDPFLTAVVLEELDERCTQLSVVRPDTGHWLPRSHPTLLADLVRDHVAAHR